MLTILKEELPENLKLQVRELISIIGIAIQESVILNPAFSINYLDVVIHSNIKIYLLIYFVSTSAIHLI